MVTNGKKEASRRLEILGIGHAIVDRAITVQESDLARYHLQKSTMQLVSCQQAQKYQQAIKGGKTTAGGGVANSMAAIALLGGQSGFIGKIALDAPGVFFAQDLADLGVQFFPIPLAKAEKQKAVSGQCMIFITPDGERTMCTCLGVSSTIPPQMIGKLSLPQAKFVYLEGYLLDGEYGRALLGAFCDRLDRRQTRVALNLCDPLLVARHHAILYKFIEEKIDILIANEQEFSALAAEQDPSLLARKIVAQGKILAVTYGAQGSLLRQADQSEKIQADKKRQKVLDTTGAGDFYAAGLLLGLARGRTLRECGVLASAIASDIVTCQGARPSQNLRNYARECGIFWL